MLDGVNSLLTNTPIEIQRKSYGIKYSALEFSHFLLNVEIAEKNGHRCRLFVNAYRQKNRSPSIISLMYEMFMKTKWAQVHICPMTVHALPSIQHFLSLWFPLSGVRRLRFVARNRTGDTLLEFHLSINNRKILTLQCDRVGDDEN